MSSTYTPQIILIQRRLETDPRPVNVPIITAPMMENIVTSNVTGAPLRHVRNISLYGSGKKMMRTAERIRAPKNVRRHDVNTCFSPFFGIRTPSVMLIVVLSVFVAFGSTEIVCCLIASALILSFISLLSIVFFS